MAFVFEDAPTPAGRFIFEDNMPGLSSYLKDTANGVVPLQGADSFRPSATIPGVKPLQPSYPSPTQKTIVSGVKDFGGAAIGQLESAAQMAGGFAAFPVDVGVTLGATIGTLARGGSMDESTQNIQDMQAFIHPYLVYEPKTTAGKKASAGIGKFLDWLIHRPAETAGGMAQAVIEPMAGKTAGAIGGAVAEAGLNLAGYAALLGSLGAGSKKIGIIKEKIAERRPLTNKEVWDFEQHLKEGARITKGLSLPPEDILNALTGRQASKSAVGYISVLSSRERNLLARALLKKETIPVSTPTIAPIENRGLKLPSPEIQTATAPPIAAAPVSPVSDQLGIRRITNPPAADTRLMRAGSEIANTPVIELSKVKGRFVFEDTLPDERMAGSDAVAVVRENMATEKNIRHYTAKENIPSILQQGFDTTRKPIHGIGGHEAGEKISKWGKDVLYFTTDDTRWNTAKIFVGEGKGNIDRDIYDYKKQAWGKEINAYKSIQLSAISANIKPDAKIAVIDSLSRAEEFLGHHINRFEFIHQLIDKARKDGVDILNLKNPNGTAWNDITPDKNGNLNRYEGLTGGSGKDDYFILNKNAIKIKAPVMAKPTQEFGLTAQATTQAKAPRLKQNNLLDIQPKFPETKIVTKDAGNTMLDEIRAREAEGKQLGIKFGKKVAKAKISSLSNFVRKQGGLSNKKESMKGELRRFTFKEGYNLINNKTGKTLDDMVEAAWGAGFFGENRPSINEFLDALENDVNAKKGAFGKRVYSMEDADEVYRLELEAEWKKHKGEVGAISLSGMPSGLARKFVKRTQEFFEPTSTIPDSDAYKIARYRKYGWADRTERLAQHVFERLEKLSPEVRKDMFYFLDGKNTLMDLPKATRPLAQSLQTVNNMIGRMLLKRGKISPETYRKHENNYVRYFYTEHFVEKTNANAIVKGNRIDTTAFEGRIDPKIIENLGGKEYVDKAVYEGLLKIAESLGIRHRRVKAAGRGALGHAERGTGRIVTQYATEISVLAHEIGHQLDFKYGLWDKIVRDARGISEHTGKITQEASSAKRYEIQKELRTLADLFFKGSESTVTEYMKKKVRAKAEKLARLLEAYIHAPEQFKSVAPTVYEIYDKFLESHPELTPLRRIKPEIALTEEQLKGYQVVSEGGKPYSKPFLSLDVAKSELARQQERVALLRKEMGFIEDVAVAQPLGMASSLLNIGNIDFFKTVADNPDWTWLPSFVEIKTEGKPIKMSIGRLVDEVAAATKTYKELPESPEVEARLERLQGALDMAMEQTKNMPDGYYRMPNSPTYGDLAGAFVRKEIAKDILSLMPHGPGRLAELSITLDTIAKIEAKGMAAFKISKTALNLPTIIRNIVSNPFQMMMDGVHPWEIPTAVIKAIQSRKTKDGDFHAALKRGLFKTNMQVTELNEVLDIVGAIGPNPSYYDIVKQLMRLTKFYGHIDDLFKHASYIYWKGKGLTENQAALKAQDTGMDYSLAHPTIKSARRHIIPFASYSYKMISKTARTLRYRPWIIAAMLAIPSILTEISLRTLNLTKEEYKALMDKMPSLIKRGMYVVVPWRSSEGDVQWVNVEYFLPIQNLWKGVKDVYRSNYGEAIKDTGLGGPFIDIMTVINTARGDESPEDPFTGQPIFNRMDTRAVKAGKLAQWLYERWMPSMLTRYGAVGYLDRYKEGQKDKYGRTVTLPQAAGRLFGVNIIAPTAKQGRIERYAKIKQLQADFFKYKRDNPNMTEKELSALRTRYKTKLRELQGD